MMMKVTPPQSNPGQTVCRRCTVEKVHPTIIYLQSVMTPSTTTILQPNTLPNVPQANLACPSYYYPKEARPDTSFYM